MMNFCGFFVLLAAVSWLGYVSDARSGALERLMKPRICSTVQSRWLSMALPANFRGVTFWMPLWARFQAMSDISESSRSQFVNFGTEESVCTVFLWPLAFPHKRTILSSVLESSLLSHPIHQKSFSGSLSLHTVIGVQCLARSSH